MITKYLQIEDELLARENGQGVGSFPVLHDGAPATSEGLSGQDINLTEHRIIETEAVKQSKINEVSDHVISVEWRLGSDHSVKQTTVIQDGDVTVNGKGVAAVLLLNGSYFFVNGNRLYAIDKFASHERSFFRAMLEVHIKRISRFLLGAKYIVAEGVEA
jgi:hypothetical protein